MYLMQTLASTSYNTVSSGRMCVVRCLLACKLFGMFHFVQCSCVLVCVRHSNVSIAGEIPHTTAEYTDMHFWDRTTERLT
jgi:hypothetical protein